MQTSIGTFFIECMVGNFLLALALFGYTPLKSRRVLSRLFMSITLLSGWYVLIEALAGFWFYEHIPWMANSNALLIGFYGPLVLLLAFKLIQPDRPLGHRLWLLAGGLPATCGALVGLWLLDNAGHREVRRAFLDGSWYTAGLPDFCFYMAVIHVVLMVGFLSMACIYLLINGLRLSPSARGGEIGVGLSIGISGLISMALSLGIPGLAELNGPSLVPMVAATVPAYVFWQLKKQWTREEQDHQRLRQDLKMQTNLAMAGRMLAHDVRRPFEVMQMVFEQIRDSGTGMDQSMKELEASMTKASRRVTHMLRDLTELSPDRKGELYVISPVSLINALMDSLKRREHQFHYEQRHYRKVLGDFHRLFRVLENLVRNATEAAPPGSTIRIITDETNKNGRFMVNFHVINTGSRLSESDRRKIFEPWYTSGKRKGTGLGLAIVKKLVEEAGGYVDGHNLPDGSGVEFIVGLEVAAGEDDDVRFVVPPPVTAGGSEEDPVPVPPVARREGRPVVLVMDDEKVFLKSWKRHLEKEGNVVLDFTCPRLARRALQDSEWRPDMVDYIVTDYYFDDRTISSSGFLPWMRSAGFRGKAFLASSGVDFDDLPEDITIVPKTPTGLKQLLGDPGAGEEDSA